MYLREIDYKEVLDGYTKNFIIILIIHSKFKETTSSSIQ